MNLDALETECVRLSKLTNAFGESSEQGFLQKVARTAELNFKWSMQTADDAFASERSISERPMRDIWSALLRGWSAPHSSDEWMSLLPMLARLESTYSLFLSELSSLLKSAIDAKVGGLPKALIPQTLEITDAVLRQCSTSEQALPEVSDNWLSVALNRTSGYLLQFYFDALRSLWATREQEQSLIQAILKSLTRILGEHSPSSDIAQILTAAYASLCAGMDLAWHKAYALPLLAKPASQRSAEQVWDGYLYWGRWSQETLSDLLPAYLGYLPQILTASDDRSRLYCGHLASITVLGSIDPSQTDWLNTFLIQSGLRERISWAEQITRILEELDDKAKEATWDRWLRGYLERRAQATPLPLDEAEAGVIAEWALRVRAHYPAIIAPLLVGPAPNVKGKMFYYRLYEASIVDEAPVATARLLTALLTHEESRDFYEWDQLHGMVERLIDLIPAEPSLGTLCEVLGTVGSARALEFRRRLPEGRQRK